MNPHVLQPPVNPAPRLVDRRATSPAFIPVALTRGYPASNLNRIESSWNPARATLAASLRGAGFALESRHWDWRNKMHFYPSGWHCLVAVEAEGEVQGLMAVETSLRRCSLSPSDWLVYVDYLEAAPWNRREPPDQTTEVRGRRCIALE